MHEEDDEGEGDANGDDDAFVVHGADVGLLLGEAVYAGVGCGVVVVIADGAVCGDEIGGVIVIVVVVGGVRVPPEISIGGRGCEEPCDDEAEPEEEIAGYVCAGVDWAVAEEEDEYVGEIPEDGEAEGDEFPREEPDVAVEGPVVEGEVGVVVDVVRDRLVG